MKTGFETEKNTNLFGLFTSCIAANTEYYLSDKLRQKVQSGTEVYPTELPLFPCLLLHTLHNYIQHTCIRPPVFKPHWVIDTPAPQEPPGIRAVELNRQLYITISLTFCPCSQCGDHIWMPINKPWALWLRGFQSKIGSNIALRLYSHIPY